VPVLDRKVLLVEDDEKDAKRYKRFLEKSGDVAVEIIEPMTSFASYGPLISDPSTGAMVIDQRLDDATAVQYSGTQLALWIRTMVSDLPIFALTNYPGDIDQSENVYISVFDKGKIAKDSKVYSDFIRESIQRYNAALTEKQQRLRELIDKKIDDELSESEAEELATLRADFERPADLILAEQSDAWESYLQEFSGLVEQLRQIGNKIDKLD
jgi:CheY-like chemotaxis protein